MTFKMSKMNLVNPEKSCLQSNRKHRAAIGGVSRRKRSTMLRDDPMRQSQSHAMPLRFRRKKWNEDLLQVGGGNSFTRVMHLDDCFTRPHKHASLGRCFRSIAH